MKVQITTKAGSSFIVDMAVTNKIAPHFTLKELANNKGSASKPQYIIDDYTQRFMDMIEQLRSWYGKSMTVNSCYRQKEYNASVGGDSRSAHLHGCAIDWGIKGQTNEQRQKVAAKWEGILKANGVIGSINYYTNGYHLEAFSDEWFGQKSFQIRDYRGKKGDW